MPVKLENDAGVEALLHVMERETTQVEMLGALVKKLDIEDAYVRSESVVAVIDCAMSRVSDQNEDIFHVQAYTSPETSSYDDDANTYDYVTFDPFKSNKTIENNEVVT